jgi:peptidoglycan/LPS O-acetylase OafA/YrhL
MKINSIQVLRALAVVMVTHVHAIDLQMLFARSVQQNFYYLQNLGAIGVDLFFVISGFIISHVAGSYSGGYDGYKFLKKRFLRINPIYYIATAIYFVLTCFFDKYMGLNELFLRVFNSLVIIPVLPLQINTFVPLLGVGWSLSFEWLFYLIFCCTILLRIKNKMPCLVVLIGALVTAGRLYHPDLWFIFYTHPLLLEFLFGVIIHWLYISVKLPKAIAYTLFMIGIAGYVFNIFHNFKDIAELGNILLGDDQLTRVLLWGIPSIFLFAGSIFLEKAGVWYQLWNHPFLLRLGDASYSIYLCHPLVYYFLMLLYMQIGFFLNPDLAIFLQMTLGIAGGLLFYKFIEKPVVAFFHPPAPKVTVG